MKQKVKGCIANVFSVQLGCSYISKIEINCVLARDLRFSIIVKEKQCCNLL